MLANSILAESSIATPIAIAAEPKKPSYLNLACCVNGYSNLTTYDSKFRQNINKSREVSPIRPITTTTSQPGVTTVNGHLAVPNYYPTIGQSLTMNSNNVLESHRSVMSPEKRLFTAHIMQSATITSANMATSAAVKSNGNDITDNVMNDRAGDQLFKTTKYLYTQSASDKNTTNGTNGVHTAATGNGRGKSFIEQRVELMYGPGALAQGFHRRSTEKTVLSERNIYSNTPTKSTHDIGKHHHITSLKDTSQVASNGLFSPKKAGSDGENGLMEKELPVLRHLRPEFRAQLPLSSPKRSPPKNYNGTADEDLEVLVNQPVSLQFQTVSISKLQTASSPSIANGVVANRIKTETPVPDDRLNAMTVNCIDGDVTSGAAVASSETIENNNREDQFGGGCSSSHNNKTSREATVNENGSESRVGIKETEVKMPTKEKEEVNERIAKDGNFFLDVMNNERNRILGLADICDRYMDELVNC